MDQQNKYVEPGIDDRNQAEKLKFEDMDILYENFQNDKHSLNDYFSSLGSFLKFISSNIDYSTNLIDNLIAHLKDNRNPGEIELLSNAVNEENKTIKHFIGLLSGFFESRNSFVLESSEFNKVMDDILVRLAEYTESKRISIFKKFGEDVIVKIDKDQFFLACLQIIKSWCENISENGKIFITTKKNNNKIEIEFRDNISGIPDEILKYIFEPSNPLEHDWEFDLVLANKIINEHFGKISVNRSEELNTLVITLPIFRGNEFDNLISERLI